jgi:hypothetical protein
VRAEIVHDPTGAFVVLLRLLECDPKTGAIDPGVVDHIPGLAALRTADVLVLFTRFRDLPDDDSVTQNHRVTMDFIINYHFG